MTYIKDPCGIFCVLLSYVSVLYVDYVVVFHLIRSTFDHGALSFFLCLGYNIITFLLIVSHLSAVLSDPGVVPFPEHALDLNNSESCERYRNSLQDGWSVCVKCSMYRPPRAHHCRVCQRCIRKMDHHCPWINNCVGEFNQKYFIQFLFYVGLSAVYAMAMILVSWLCDSNSGWKGHREKKMIHSVIAGVISVLFGLFVLAIGFDQIDAIFSDTTAVEYMKNRNQKGDIRYKSHYSLLKEVFGPGLVLLWLLPCHHLLQSQAPRMQHHNERFPEGDFLLATVRPSSSPDLPSPDDNDDDDHSNNNLSSVVVIN